MTARTSSRVQGLYGIADAHCSANDPVRLAAQLIAGGCRIIQLRCKDWKSQDVEHAARAIKRICVDHSALFVVNDHAEIAATVGAHGVHLGQTDEATDDVRAQYGDRLFIGRSTNSLEQLTHTAKNADYLAFGPVFTTQNLSRAKPTQGIDLLAQARKLVPHQPLVAIGGITHQNLAEVRATGVDAWAVISAIANATDPVAATRKLIV